MPNYNLDRFNKLCYRAQELIFDMLEEYIEDLPPNIFSVKYLDEDLDDMTPIEQIFSVGAMLVEYKMSKLSFNFVSQKHINIDNHSYIADFYTDMVTLWSAKHERLCDFLLKKPLVIELDGYDYHSNKEQMQHDYERENNLKANGYDVIRFTGSQVYNNVYDCLHIVYNYIKNNRIEEEIK